MLDFIIWGDYIGICCQAIVNFIHYDIGINASWYVVKSVLWEAPWSQLHMFPSSGSILALHCLPSLTNLLSCLPAWLFLLCLSLPPSWSLNSVPDETWTASWSRLCKASCQAWKSEGHCLVCVGRVGSNKNSDSSISLFASTKYKIQSSSITKSFSQK